MVSVQLAAILLVWFGYAPSHAVITRQGMTGDKVEEEREFVGWLTGNAGDYQMSAISKRKVGAGGQKNSYVGSANSIQIPSIEYTFNYTRGPYNGFPSKVMGMYILLADDTEKGFESNADWSPMLYPYQQEGANVLFFTFINPETMEIPLSFKKLASTRGTGVEGAVPRDTLIIFAIGGYQYSIYPNPWEWLTSREKAEDMAIQVARWRDDFGIDGIDLDIEEGAGSRKEAGPNLLHFIRKIKSIHPDLLVSQPTYGYPQVQAEIDVINGSWRPGGSSKGLADSIGLMVYEGTQALIYLKNYETGSEQWDGFPIKVDVPSDKILLGCKGSASKSDITSLARSAVKKDLLGVMVWYCSVRNGLKYAETWDCTGREDSENGYVQAMDIYKQYTN